MNYSIVPPECLCPTYDFQETVQQMHLNGALVEVRVLADGARVERIISGDLNSFLDPKLKPGTIIKKGLH